jgi:hypothetical protein
MTTALGFIFIIGSHNIQVVVAQPFLILMCTNKIKVNNLSS